MPKFRITVKQPTCCNGVRLERGMSVVILSNSYNNPVMENGGQPVAYAFYRHYGVDIKRARALDSNYLDVQKIG